MEKRLYFLFLLPFIIIPLFAQPQAGYYTSSTLNGKNGRDLELALKAIVYQHTKIDYNSLWTAYKTTDPGPQDSIPSTYTGGKTDLVYDMYAWMAQFPKFYSDNDHSQTSGFNREHCVPNSWWGGESGNAIAYTDLHHLVPGDGAANNAKGNYALGEYKSGMTLVFPNSTKQNTSGNTYVTADPHNHTEGEFCNAAASHVWKPAAASQYGGSANLYEPTDEYKGDFARMYLYVVCAYEGELTWQTNYMFSSDANKYTTILPWAKELLLKWHRQDPVSDKERNRNNAVFGIQGNRNPFIDYPELVEYIWGDKSSQSFSLTNAVSAYSDEYKNQGKQPAKLIITFHVKLGDDFTGLTLNTNSDGTITYSSSNPAVATVNSQTGAVVLVGKGTATIKVTTSATANFSASEESYKIDVR